MEETIINGNSNDNNNDNGTPTLDNSKDDGGQNIDYKERYSQSTREYQKLANEKKAMEFDREVNNAFKNVLKDQSYLLDLDEDVAIEVTKHLYEIGAANTDSFEELAEQIKSYLEDNQQEEKKINPDEIAKNVRAQILDEQEKDKALDVLDNLISKYDEETQNKYLEEFEEILGDRKLTPAFAKREMEKIIFINNKEKLLKEKGDEALSNMASNGLGKSSKSTSTDMTIEKLDALGVPKHEQKSLYPDLFTKK